MEMESKKCKLCDKPRYANLSLCFKHYKEREKTKKLEKEKRKLEKKQSTKKYQKGIEKKLMSTNDRLFQELGRLVFKTCYFGHTYSCIHHFVRKSQSLFLRYELKNAIPVCQGCHCSIHIAENTMLEARFVLKKGEDWLKGIESGKRVIILDKLKFLQEQNLKLKSQIEQYGD
jgi:5-methylcytosine-specific restriction endonuclease McrA